MMDKGYDSKPPEKGLETALEHIFNAASPDKRFVNQLAGRLEQEVEGSRKKWFWSDVSTSIWRTASLGAAILALIIVLVWGINNLIPPSETALTDEETPTLSPFSTSSPALTNTPGIEPTLTPQLLPGQAEIIFREKLTCLTLGDFIKCVDRTLNLEFEYPTSWGEVEAVLRTGDYTGFAYDYFFAGKTISESEPLVAGGRSQDFSEGRGAMPTDFAGYGEAGLQYRQICDPSRSDLFPICQEAKPEIAWMILFPNANYLCDGYPSRRVQPVFRIEINLPDNPRINGFVIEAPFLSDEFITKMENELYSLIGFGEEGLAAKCGQEDQQAFDTLLLEFLEEINTRTMDDEINSNLDQLHHLVNSINFLDGKRVEDNRYGFSFHLPSGYVMESIPTPSGIAYSLGIVREGDIVPPGERYPINLTVYEKPASVDLLDWFTQHHGSEFFESGQLPRGVFFLNPHVLNFNYFRDRPALQYESTVWNHQFESLVVNGEWVIGFAYLIDQVQDYEKDYTFMLASLKLFEPEQVISGTGTPTSPQSTPPVCLDESARPIPLPERQKPLTVHFISDGNIWIWEESSQTARQISDTRDTRDFLFSPDGEVVAFYRGVTDSYYQVELWAIDADGSNLRKLVSVEQQESIAGEPSTTEFRYHNRVEIIEWLPDEPALVFVVSRTYDAIGFSSPEISTPWKVDIESSNLEPWPFPVRHRQPDPGLLSPDGSQMAVIGTQSLTLMNADGTNRREDVFTFDLVPSYSGYGFLGPSIFWALDSQSLFAITYVEDWLEHDATFRTWRIPVDGSQTEELATFTGMAVSSYVSPDQRYLAYYRVMRPYSNDRELHIAMFDGSRDVVYARGNEMEFWGWAPDGVHFIYGQSSIQSPLWGNVCGEAQPLFDPPILPAWDFKWVDGGHILFVHGRRDDWQGELRLGRVRGESILIGPYNGEFRIYRFNRDHEALGWLTWP
jgi:hypothetical protein